MIAEYSVSEAYGALAEFEHYPVILVEGPRGTAKTRSILSYFVGKLYQYPGSRLVVSRRFRTDLTKTILTTLEDEVFPSMNIERPPGPSKAGRDEYELPTGPNTPPSHIWPIGIDKLTGTFSMACTYAYPAEIIEMDQKHVQDFRASMRWLHDPNERPLLPRKPQMICDTNPGPKNHWANVIAEPVSDSLRRVKTVEDYLRLQEHNYAPTPDPVNRWKRIITRHQDNLGYWDHEKWDYRDLGATYVRDVLSSYRGFQGKRWCDGIWCNAEGSVFPEFNEEIHTYDPYPDGMPREWPATLAKDPGRDHPDATLIGVVSPAFVIRRRPSGDEYKMHRIYIDAESVTQGTNNIDDARTIDTEFSPRYRIVKKLGDPHMMFSETKFSETGKSIAQQMADLGHIFMPAPAARNNADINQQAEMIRTLLVTLHPEDKLPMLMISKACPRTIGMLMSLAYERSRSGDIKQGDDKIQTLDDDEFDALRMIVSSEPQFGESQSRIYRR